jgi:flagellar biosynthesis protein FliQ
MSNPGKILLAVALAYAGLAVASLIGGFIVGVIGAALQLSPSLIRWLVWWLPKIIFALMLLLAYIVWSKRKPVSREGDSRK